jgi:hypothetical protein
MTERVFVCIEALMALDLAARELRRVHSRLQFAGVAIFAIEIANVALSAEQLIERFDRALDAIAVERGVMP